MDQEIKEIVVDLELSSACNLNCIFCPRNKIQRIGKFIDSSTTDRLAKHIGVNKVIWFSGMGEPFLHPQIAAITKRIKETGALVYTNTNGTAPAFKERLVAAMEAGLGFVNVSVYGCDQASYEKTANRNLFDVLRDNVLFLQGLGVPYRISYVVDDGSPTDIESMLGDVFNTRRIRLLRRHHRSLAEGMQPVASQCGLAQNYLFISCDGNVFSCVNDVGGLNNFGPDILPASEMKRRLFPYPICQHCDSGQGIGIKSFAPDFLAKIINLS